MRIGVVCLALAVAPAVSAKELKPKFGHRIDGILHADLASEHDRQECRETIKRMITACRSNTNFVSNTEARKYPACLPVFRQQAENCAAHFRAERIKCDWSGRVRIDDFDGFGCTVTEAGTQEDGEQERNPDIAPAYRLMQTRTRTNVRSGPGTDYAKTGLLNAGEQVQVTGETGDWVRIEAPAGGAAFVHGSLLVMPEARGSTRAPSLSPMCDGMPEGSQCWREISNKPDCFIWDDYSRTNQSITWSGLCSNNVTAGPGTLRYEWNDLFVEGKGTLSENGEPVGRWSWHHSDRTKSEGPYKDGKRHGRWVFRYTDGDITEMEGSYKDGKRHGRWLVRFADGDVLGRENGKPVCGGFLPAC